MLDVVLARHGVERVAGPHCFAFYQGNAAFEAIGDGDMMAFYMTDFLCRQFEAFFIKPLGLDRHPELVADYFGNYEKLVHLAQTDDPELDRVAVDAAKWLGLALRAALHRLWRPARRPGRSGADRGLTAPASAVRETGMPFRKNGEIRARDCTFAQIALSCHEVLTRAGNGGLAAGSGQDTGGSAGG